MRSRPVPQGSTPSPSKLKRIALLATLAAMPLISAAQPAQTQAPASPAATQAPDGPVLQMNVKLVNVFTNVADATGAIVGGLKRKDFAITEDVRPQRIAGFERQSELPLTLVLAIDTSGSV